MGREKNAQSELLTPQLHLVTMVNMRRHGNTHSSHLSIIPTILNWGCLCHGRYHLENHHFVLVTNQNTPAGSHFGSPDLVGQ